MTSSAIPSHVACPACQQITPLPSQTALTAVVRCPHCRAQFALQDLVGDPEVVWQLVSDAEQQRSASTQSVQEEIDFDAEPRDAGIVIDDPDLEDGDLLTGEYGFDVASAGMPPAASPGAETVEMSDYEALVESWKDTPPIEKLAESPAEQFYEPTADVVFDAGQDVQSQLQPQESLQLQEFDESQPIADPADTPAVDPDAFVQDEGRPRKLEGPLVGEFADDPAPGFEYPGESSWRSLAARAAVDPLQREGSATMGEPDVESGFQSFSNGPAVRRSRPRRSPLWSMLQVSLGGLAAIPVSLLLMWHLLGTDIGGAAPWVAQYAPWIVPQKFHAYAPSPSPTTNSPHAGSMADSSASQSRLPVPEMNLTTESLNEEHPADEIPTVQPRGLSDVDLAADSLDATTDSFAVDSQTNDTLPAADTLVKSGRSDGNAQAGGDYAAEMPDGVVSPEDQVDDYKLDSQSLAAMLDGLEPLDMAADAGLPAASSLDNSAESTTSTDISSGDNSAQASPDELDSTALETCFTLIRETDSMLEEWSLAVSAKRHDMALAQETYGELASLALAVDELPTRDIVQQAMRGQLRPVRKQVEQKLEVRNLIDQGARFWIRSQTQDPSEANSGSIGASDAEPSGATHYGLALTAVVDSVIPSDDGKSSTITGSATTQSGSAAELPLDLQIPQDLILLLPEGKLSVGQKLFLLGTVNLPTDVATGEATGDSNAAPEKYPFVANYITPL